MNILITGGAGYIGSVLTGLLLDNGYNVRTIDRLYFGGNGLVRHLGRDNFDFHCADICSESALDKALEDIDCVVHLAAVVGDPPCRKYPELAVRINKEGSELLCAKAHDKKIERFIFASTCSNYGKMEDPDMPVDETSVLKPVSLYAELKVGFEKYLLEHASASFHPVCLRFSTAYGLSPRQRFDLTVNEFTRDLFKNKNLEIYGGQFWRPYCHTQDLSRAVKLMIESDPDLISGDAFNVGANDENYQKQSLIDLILKQLPDKSDNIEYVEKDEDPRDYRVNFDKISDRFGFELTRTVPDGISEIIHALEHNVISDPFDTIYTNLELHEEHI